MRGRNISVGTVTRIWIEEEENMVRFPAKETDFFLATYRPYPNRISQNIFRSSARNNGIIEILVYHGKTLYRGADKSLARPD